MSDRYKDLQKARMDLAKNKNFLAALDLAKKEGVFKVHVSGLEKWNQPEWEGDELIDTNVPRANGHFDVEGHCWTDIYGYVRFGFRDWLNEWPRWWKDVREVWSWRGLKSSLRFVWQTVPFSPVHEFWLWTVQSFDVVKSDMAGDMAFEKWGSKEITKEFIGVERSILDSLTYDQVLEKVSEDYLQVNRFIWVGKLDQTVVVIDESQLPYDMKNGWSNTAILFILRVWLHWLTESKLTFMDKHNPSAVNKIDRSVKMGMIDVERGNFAPSEEVRKLLDERRDENGGNLGST